MAREKESPNYPPTRGTVGVFLRLGGSQRVARALLLRRAQLEERGAAEGGRLFAWLWWELEGGAIRNNAKGRKCFWTSCFLPGRDDTVGVM